MLTLNVNIMSSSKLDAISLYMLFWYAVQLNIFSLLSGSARIIYAEDHVCRPMTYDSYVAV